MYIKRGQFFHAYIYEKSSIRKKHKYFVFLFVSESLNYSWRAVSHPHWTQVHLIIDVHSKKNVSCLIVVSSKGIGLSYFSFFDYYYFFLSTST